LEVVVTTIENVENKDANRCFLLVFKTILWKLELHRNFWN